MLSETQAIEIKSRLAGLNAWIDENANKPGSSVRKSKTGISYKPEDVPIVLNVSNEERSALEVYEFVNNPPSTYFAYVSASKPGKLTTWMGEELGDIQFGPEYRDSFGGTRVPVRVCAINGGWYSGTYYKSAGDYVRLKLTARKNW